MSRGGTARRDRQQERTLIPASIEGAIAPRSERAETTIANLEELRLSAVEDKIDADLALGRHPDVVGELQTLVAEHPLRERLRAQYMLALYRSGRQAEALEGVSRSATDVDK